MKARKIETLAVFFLLGLIFLAVPAGLTDYEWLKDRHPVQVTVEGDMTLEGEAGIFNITIHANFTAMVPNQLVHGNYTATFEGEAKVTKEIIRFRGVIAISNYEKFCVSFRIPNTYPEIPLSDEVEVDMTDDHEHGEEYDVTGTLEVTIGKALTPFPIEKTWIRIMGCVNSYGIKPAFGFLKAHAKIGEWAGVHAFWTTLPLHLDTNNGNHDLPIIVPRSFYAARLVNTTTVEVDYSGNDLYILGQWKVFNITWTYQGERNFTCTYESVALDETGEFKVTGGWREFILDIAGVDQVKGKVVFLLHRMFVIPHGDVNNDYIVNIWDLVHVARRYGATPGKPGFDFNIDLDDDFEVGLCELTTIGANLGTEY